MPASVPEPQLVGDVLEASLIETASGVALAFGALPPDLPPECLRRPAGPLIVRYAWAYLYRDDLIVPGLIATEYGGMLVGREGWDFALKHSNLHPRADAVGLRSDGKRDQVMLRELDFGQPVAVLVYESAEATLPLARVTACWIGPGAPPLPDLLATHLPRLDRLTNGP